MEKENELGSIYIEVLQKTVGILGCALTGIHCMHLKEFIDSFLKLLAEQPTKNSLFNSNFFYVGRKLPM